MSEHIDEFALFSYAVGYSHLRMDVVQRIQEHLDQCPECAERFRREVQELTALPEESEKEAATILELSPVLRALAQFLTAEKGLDSLRWFRHAYHQLASALKQGQGARPDAAADTVPVVSRGFMSTHPCEDDRHEDGELEFSREEKQMVDNMCSLFRILGDDNIDITQRARLAEELHIAAKKMLEDTGRQVG